MSAESIALDAEITIYMAAHTSSEDWPTSLRAFDVINHCGDVVLDRALDREAMFDAEVVVAFWIDTNEANRPA